MVMVSSRWNGDCGMDNFHGIDLLPMEINFELTYFEVFEMHPIVRQKKVS